MGGGDGVCAKFCKDWSLDWKVRYLFIKDLRLSIDLKGLRGLRMIQKEGHKNMSYDFRIHRNKCMLKVLAPFHRQRS